MSMAPGDGTDQSETEIGYEEGSENFVAVVGMAGRYPESPDLDAFWANLRQGNDCLHTFSDDEMAALGIPLETVQVDNFVPRGTRLPDRDSFDARFFGYTPRNAAITDPQARIFLETCYEALENSGYNPFDPGCPVGVFAGSNPNDYALLLGVADPTDSLGAFDQLIGVDRDFIATRVSHKLGLTGPAMTIQTACSTSLVTVHVAVQSLLAYECSMALAGGVSVNLRQGVGYFYQPGMILSPTGECRAFDARAQGTTLGQGCGAVVLKRLTEAQEDGDNILAVIRATAINNDGSNKIGYTAPSEDGQVEVISMAHELAGVESDSIGYVETHGTGTLLGDPIEIAALTRAFRPGTTRQQYCAIGSAKTNFGHTDAAAGITGFIKAVLTLHHGEIPPSIHFDEPNPDIDFENSPFFVNTELRPFPAGQTPRRAGVSAFGIGGTNAHVILEEAPTRTKPGDSGDEGRPRVLTLSARSSSAADQRVADLAKALDGDDPYSPAAVDYTLRHGRPTLEHRRGVVLTADRPLSDAVDGGGDRNVVRGSITELGPPDATDRAMVWLFAGQGAQYPTMGAGLYEREPVFRDAVDRVAEHLLGPLACDIRALLFPPATANSADAAEQLRQTSITQPALFAVEHAMAALLASWDLRPSAVIGHSIGEYAAAVEAGIMSWSDGATLVAERGRLMQLMQPGAMLSVSMSAQELMDRLPAGAELAADNSTSMSVASGATEVIEALAADLELSGASVQVLHTSHAFHSAMMDEAAEQFADALADVQLSRPTTPLISNVTGQAITDTEAIDPSFWAQQIRKPVRFTDCLTTASAPGGTLFVELGPGRALSTFAMANHRPEHSGQVLAVPTMRHPRQERDDQVVLLEAVARLWTAGHDVNWDLVNGPADPRRIPLPTYPFERAEAWLPPYRHVLALPHFGPPSEATRSVKREPLDHWLYTPSWQRRPLGDQSSVDGVVVVLAPEGPGGDRLVASLSAAGVEVVEVRPDPTADSSVDDQLAALFADVTERQLPVASVVHAWAADPGAPFETADELERCLDYGVHTALACARGLSTLSRSRTIRLNIVTAGAFDVTGGEAVRPDAAALLGPTKVIPLEYGGLTTRHIDVADGLSFDDDCQAVVRELLSSESALGPDEVVALRHGQRWAPTVAVRPTTAAAEATPLRHGGRYLIVGGLGGVGLSIAEHLAGQYGASLVLTGRRGRPVPSGDDDTEALRRLELLDQIEDAAHDLQVVAVDMTDDVAMSELIDELEASGPPINGVIVAAGVADRSGAIHRRSRADMEASIASKVQGLVALDRAIGDRNLDFVLLSSSIAATLYHNRFAQVGYVTGNAFAEAFAVRSRRRGRPVTTVAWDDWLDVGMSVRAARDFSADFGTDVNLVDELNSFAPADGVELFERALRTNEPVLLVSPTELGQRIEDDVDVVSPFLEQAMADDDLGDEDELGEAAEWSTAELVKSVWSALLGFEDFDPMDDFFELGGDSLQAARMVDRLSRALNTEVPVDIVFDNARLAPLVEVLEGLQSSDGLPAGDDQTSEVEGSGPTPLGPAQLRFLDRRTEQPNHFNVSVLLQPKRRLDHEHVQAAMEAVVTSHSALRLTITAGLNGEEPYQEPNPPATGPGVDIVDLRSMGPGDAVTELERHAAHLQQSLDLEAGPIARAVLYELPDDDQRLLIVIHHLMSDRISLLLILDAIDAELRRMELNNGDAPSSRSAPSFLQWVSAQAEAASANHDEMSTRWAERDWSRVLSVPVDHEADADSNRNSHASAVTVTVGAEEMAQAAGRSQARPDEVVLLALARALSQWSGAEAALIDVMGHGRRLPLGIDVSRSVGMFITYSPVLVDSRQWGEQRQLDELRADLEHGWSFDALRFYGPPAIQEQMASIPRAQVLFNYVGQSIATTADAILVPTDEPRGPEVDPNGRRDHLLAIRADVLDDGDLNLIFVFSEQVHERSTIETLAGRTVQLINPSAAMTTS